MSYKNKFSVKDSGTFHVHAGILFCQLQYSIMYHIAY